MTVEKELAYQEKETKPIWASWNKKKKVKNNNGNQEEKHRIYLSIGSTAYRVDTTTYHSGTCFRWKYVSEITRIPIKVTLDRTLKCARILQRVWRVLFSAYLLHKLQREKKVHEQILYSITHN